MRNAMGLAGFVLSCIGVSAALAVEPVPLREPRVWTQQAPQGKTRDEVKRELAAWRAAGCMDVTDSQYPQPCPLPGATRSMADAFQVE